MSSLPVITVSEQTLRDIFRQERYWERAQAGDLLQIMIRVGRYSPSFEPAGTKTHMVKYIDKLTNQQVAVVHQYVRPDGSLGASGQPDPKWLFHNGVIYKS